MNFGLCGIGKMGQRYISNLKEIEGASINCCCSRSFEKFCRLKNGLEFNWTADYKTLCSRNTIDGIIIATHPDSHYEIAKEALLNKKHVICEKPFIQTDEKIEELKTLAESNGLNFVIDYTQLWQPKIQEFFSIIKNKKPAKFSIYSENKGNGPFRIYSSLWDWGVHDMALCLTAARDSEYVSIKATKIEPFDFGNLYFITLNFKHGMANILTGNGSLVKRRTFYYRDEDVEFHFEDKGEENPLKIMLEIFINCCENGIKFNNLGFTQKVNFLIREIEKETCDK